MSNTPFRTLVAGTTVLVLAAAMAVPARASLNSPVSLSLIAPGGFTDGTNVTSTPISETASGDPAVGFVVGDPASLITSFYMLPGESVTFSGNSILLTVAGGAEVGGQWMTGYLGLGSDHARYVVGDLSITGQTITGIQVHSGGAVLGGVDAALSGPGQVSFNLDQLTFSAPTGGNSYPIGNFTIDLVTQPVPEPASAALLLAGLVGLTVRRMTSRGAASRGTK